MLIVGTDAYPDAQGGSFNTAYKVDPTGSKVYVQAYTNDALTSNEVAMAMYDGSTYLATSQEASVVGYICFAQAAIASGCLGWVQIRGVVSNVVSAAGSFTGSVGHAVSWGVTASAGLHASDSFYQTLEHHVGWLVQAATATTSTKMFLAGKLSTAMA